MVENMLYKLDGVISDSLVFQVICVWDFENGDCLLLFIMFCDIIVDDDGCSFYLNKVSVGYVFGEIWNDVKFSLNVSCEWCDYGLILLVLDGRLDMKIIVLLNVVVCGFDIYGFYLIVMLFLIYNQLNIVFYEIKFFGIGFGFVFLFQV